MDENRNTDKLTREDETRAAKIARIAAKLPEQEQEKILYMIKGVELAEIVRAAAPQAAPN